MHDFGIIVAPDVTNTKGTFEYDSRKKKTTADLDPYLEHVKSVPLDGGTIVTTTSNQSLTETLLTIPHNMPFVPKIYAFFLVTEFPSDKQNDLQVNTYQEDTLYFIINAVGYGTEKVYIEKDTRNMYVKHNVESLVGTFGGTFNGLGSGVKFTLRYIITNLEDINSM